MFRGLCFLGALAVSSVLWTGYAKAAPAPLMYIDDVNDVIGTVNLSNGDVTILGNADTATTLGDIGFTSTGGFYGVNEVGDLYSLSTTTGKGTLVGNNGIPVGLNALVGGPDGSLYAASKDNNNLYTVNSATGIVTELGSIGHASDGDLAFVNGTLYESSVNPMGSNEQLVKIDLSPLSATVVGSEGFADVLGLASDGTGVLYATHDTEIYKVNLSTGALTPFINFGGHGLDEARGAAFPNESAGSITVVPLPSAALSGLSMLGLLAGVAVVRSRIRARRMA